MGTTLLSELGAGQVTPPKSSTSLTVHLPHQPARLRQIDRDLPTSIESLYSTHHLETMTTNIAMAETIICTNCS